MSPVRARTPRLVFAAVFIVCSGLACVTQTSPEPRESGGDSSELEPGPSCRASGEATLALLAGADPTACELALELRGAGQLALIDLNTLSEGAIVATGTAPAACADALELCRITAKVDKKLGPLILLSVRGPESEMPTQVYLGWVADAQLTFTETWYGLPSVVDHTRVGPPWALAPFECEGALELWPMARLPEAAGEAPGETLAALAGRWSLGAEGQAQPPEAPGVERPSSCQPAFSALP